MSALAVVNAACLVAAVALLITMRGAQASREHPESFADTLEALAADALREGQPTGSWTRERTESAWK